MSFNTNMGEIAMILKPETDEGAPALVCTLTDAELAERSVENGDMFQQAQQVKELDDGYAFRFAGDAATASRLLQFVLDERDCCHFFVFRLEFEPELGSIWLTVRGADGVKEIVAEQANRVQARLKG
jgi:hypothetical protein